MIGIFDSGSGGLTVLRALRRGLPEHDLVYLGDHLHAPYSDRDAEDIRALTRAGITHLLELGCRIVIIACNTAAAVSLRPLQQNWMQCAWPERHLLGVFTPLTEALISVPWTGQNGGLLGDGPKITVGVFATPRTVLSCAWRDEIRRRAPYVRVIQQQCPSLAEMIETDAPSAVLDALVGQYVSWLLARTGGVPNAVVLGSSHYPLISERFAAVLPAGVRILDQPTEIAHASARFLVHHPELAEGRERRGRTRFLTTGMDTKSERIACRFLGKAVQFEQTPTQLVA